MTAWIFLLRLLIVLCCVAVVGIVYACAREIAIKRGR